MSEFNDYDLNDETPEPENQPGEGGSNKTFILAIGILGGIFLITLVAIAIFALVVLPQNKARREAQAAQINANNTATVMAVTQEFAIQLTQSAKEIILPTATATLAPSATPVVVLATNTPLPQPSGDEAKTATIAALLTQASEAQQTITVMPTSTALPTTGFADEVGLPGLLGLTVMFLVVIFLVRRLRMSSSH